jgi:general secretion pathway protein G
MRTRLILLLLLAAGTSTAWGIWWALILLERRVPDCRSLKETTFPPIIKALERYREIVGHYPTTADGLEALLTPPSTLPPDKAVVWPLLKGWERIEGPSCEPFHYECAGTHNPGSYDLWYDEPPDEKGMRMRLDNWSTGGAYSIGHWGRYPGIP